MRKSEDNQRLSRIALSERHAADAHPTASIKGLRLPARGKQVGAVVNAIETIRFLGSNAPMRAADVARGLQLNPSTCFNILQTLVHQGVVSFEPAKKVYGLHPTWSIHPASFGLGNDDVRFKKPEAERSASRHQLFASLATQC